ncbi:hypothetical protein [Hyalangium rubrum]|uniref:Lipoprotein n=1 Tax=Hyalangium rubrum TaxID=3103134 RepID=A0ABU5GZY4_9BACT|nr:hypothetical protein [Hyalangium sp. s54d21]MDY7226763.1 hypothetical protein [Hyalangium sp. s54d21]
MRYLILASVVFLSGCCVAREELSQEKEDAQACEPGDTCVLAGSSQCTCASPVNASKAKEIDSMADNVCCYGSAVDCVAYTNPRCENGRCVADTF